MNIQELLNPKSWAERTFGGVQLHDLRRTRRAVQVARKLAENPLGSLPAHMQTWKETKAWYRLLDEQDVTKARLDAASPATDQGPSQFLPSGALGARYDRYRSVASSTSISGVGHIGNERGRGFFVQTVLTVRQETREVLGCMAKATLCAHSRSPGRTALSTAQAGRARN